jgi:uncharacterized membrane protein YhaH (DUF805 family)
MRNKIRYLIRMYATIRGRIDRLEYWIFIGLPVSLAVALDLEFGPVTAVDWILSLILLWCILAVNIKRWHDRDKTGFHVLIWFIPVVGRIWTISELGFLRGTIGPNSYGQAPRAVVPQRD